MPFLKLHQTNGIPLCLNMNKVEQFKSNGAGNTTIIFSELESMTVKESFEELESMVTHRVEHHIHLDGDSINLPAAEYVRGVRNARY